MIGGIVLAAGRSTRFGEANKLTTVWNEKPLVRHVYDAASRSELDTVCVVTGHDAQSVANALPHEARLIHNPNFKTGMAGSISKGISQLTEQQAIVVLLGDMPLVTAEHLNSMLTAFEAAASQSAIVAATNNRKLGNPVLFGAAHFSALTALPGDRGARDLIRSAKEELVTVEIGEAAARDFDTEASFKR